MSELKTRFIDDTYAEYFNTGKHEIAQIYIKSEADKVIAEKDAEIAELLAEVEDVINTYKASVESKVKIWERCKKAEADTAEKDKEISRQKYKRCLAMAKWSKAGMYLSYECDFKREWWNKWHNRWLELAEKFKEAK